MNCGESLKQKAIDKKISKNSLIILAVSLIVAIIIVSIIQISNSNTIELKKNKSQNPSAMNQEQMSAETKRLHDRIISLETEVVQEPTDLSKMTELANSYFDIGSFDKSIKYYLKVLKITPDNTSLLIDTGVSYFNLAKNDSAIFYLNKALSIDPKHEQGLYNLGIIYYNLGKTDEAVSQWKKLIQLYGNSKEAKNAQKFIQTINNQSKTL